VKFWIVALVAIAALILILSSVDFTTTQGHEHSDAELAKGCLVSLSQFQAAKASSNSGPERKLLKIGRCFLSKNADGRISLGTITEPPAEKKK